MSITIIANNNNNNKFEYYHKTNIFKRIYKYVYKKWNLYKRYKDIKK